MRYPRSRTQASLRGVSVLTIRLRDALGASFQDAGLDGDGTPAFPARLVETSATDEVVRFQGGLSGPVLTYRIDYHGDLRPQADPPPWVSGIERFSGRISETRQYHDGRLAVRTLFEPDVRAQDFTSDWASRFYAGVDFRGNDFANEFNSENGDDVLSGLGGDDDLWSQGGNDRLYGGAGDDSLSAGAQADHLAGGPGDDDMTGGEGGDILLGGRGADWLRGSPGNDRLGGGAGDDRLHGGTGRDDLTGGADDDAMTGGGGPDTFHFGPDASGDDRIADFQDGLDLIAIRGLSHRDLGFDARGGGANTLVHLDDRGSILLLGVGQADLGREDFVFL